MLLKALPLCLVLSMVDVPPSYASLLSRGFQRAHGTALRHTRGLAQDIRVAFSGILVTQSNVSPKHVVYCKPGRPSLGGSVGNSRNGTSSAGGSSRGTSSGTKTATVVKPSITGTVPASSPWKLVESHAGTSFFDGWSFSTGSDPTHGIVQYVDESSARSNSLLEVNGQGNAVMRVETTPSVPGSRMSIRITTASSLNGGLIIMDSVHMPTGCGTWPAFWSNGPNWPSGGEIDIIEGVNDYTNNQATIHTNPGCNLPNSSPNILGISGNVIGGTDCAAVTTGNQGCGIRASTSNSFGAGFNANGGGVYAMQWDSSGIAIYFFPRGSEPADIAAGVPQPDTWGAAQARWPASACDPFKFFSNHSVIFDTTLCGDWAAGVWTGSGIPGQEQSCAQRTGFPTCEAFVRASGSSFNEAYWEVKTLKIYQFRS